MTDNITYLQKHDKGNKETSCPNFITIHSQAYHSDPSKLSAPENASQTKNNTPNYALQSYRARKTPFRAKPKAQKGTLAPLGMQIL